MESIWTKNTKLPSFPSLEENRKADICIVGGGMAGILTASLLRDSDADVLLLEANRIGSGQTSGTTAKLTAQHGLKYGPIIRNFDRDTAQRYADANLAAVEQLRQLVQERHIDCDFRNCSTFLYTTHSPDILQEEYNACRALGMEVFLTACTELPFSAAALGLKHQACFHPLRLLAALAQELSIFEHTRVLRIEDHTIITDRGSVTADKIIFTCHYPFLNIPGYYFARQHQERSYVLALENAMPMEHCYLGIEEDGLSFRTWGDYLLLGGGSHRTGENREGGKYDALRHAARRYWPNSRIAAAWSAQDCIPMDGIPFIGQYAENRPDWLVATGFQKWGMSSAMAAANLLASMALGEQPPHNIFAPQRFAVAASAKQLADDTIHSIRGLGRRFLEPGRIPTEDLPAGHGGVVELDGEKLGIYRDETGELFAVSVKCPHLGCQLEWNPDEKSWDCPCHGSRFDVKGRLLDGPAQTDL